MSHLHTGSDIGCRNCGTSAPQNYCPACGQETALHPPTLREFVHEFVGHYVALEGALWRTLAMLLGRPGRLTREYLAGRRRRYVLPLRMFLTASFLFFVALKLLPSSLDEATPSDIRTVTPAAPAPGAGASSPEPALKIVRPVDCGGAGEPACAAVEGFVNNVGTRFNADPLGFVKRKRSQLVGAAPYAAFLLLPVFAGIVALAYRSRRMTYGEHVVFSLHLHSFWFIALLLIALLPRAVGEVIWWLIPLYATWAMHAVYRGRWGPTLLRAAFVSVAYGVTLLLASLALLLGLLAMA
ncbi:MAG: DUF3667 domain-containing protein [Rhizobacter sp.]|nr:DUF3667 domain-containing protein [Rhizobacter sp.]